MTNLELSCVQKVKRFFVKNKTAISPIKVRYLVEILKRCFWVLKS